MGAHGCRVAAEGGTCRRAGLVGEVPQSVRRGETRMPYAPIDGACTQPAICTPEVSCEDDQRLEIDCLPVVAPHCTIDAELGPKAPGQVQGERVDLLAQTGHLAAGFLLFITCPSLMRWAREIR